MGRDSTDMTQTFWLGLAAGVALGVVLWGWPRTSGRMLTPPTEPLFPNIPIAFVDYTL